MMIRASMSTVSRILIAMVVVWLIVIFLIGSPLWSSWWQDENDQGAAAGESIESILARLSRASGELNTLKAQNEELRNWLQTYFPPDLVLNKVSPGVLGNGNGESGEQHRSNGVQNFGDAQGGPTLEEELARRRLHSNVLEMWYYLRKKMNSSQVEFVNQLRNALLTDLNILTSRDEAWRRNQLQKLGNYVQNKITELQNPEKSNCANTKKLICQLNKGCGFGCQIHHVTYCFVVALATQRTLILNAKNWRYANGLRRKDKSAWESVFQPVSETCTSEEGSPRSSWGPHVNLEELQVIDLPIVDSLRNRPAFLPLSIPTQLSGQLSRLHGAPIVWFLGQILRYIMRPSEEMQNYITEEIKKFSFRHPIVGVHVRRTDKVGTEAKFHSLSEYMAEVEDYYKFLDQQNEQLLERIKGDNSWRAERVVYLATDDHNLWSTEVPEWEAKGYTFIGDSAIAKTAGVGRRYAFDSLRNIILDIVLLSECDYLVCTFSSQVCRISYELMQTRLKSSKLYPAAKFHTEPVDHSRQYNSLDDIYYFGGQNDHNQIAILSHKADANSFTDVDVEKGDLLGIAGNHWDGYSKGLNRRTLESGLYPSFKAIEKVDTAYFKTFNDFDEKQVLEN